MAGLFRMFGCRYRTNCPHMAPNLLYCSEGGTSSAEKAKSLVTSPFCTCHNHMSVSSRQYKAHCFPQDVSACRDDPVCRQLLHDLRDLPLDFPAFQIEQPCTIYLPATVNPSTSRLGTRNRLNGLPSLAGISVRSMFLRFPAIVNSDTGPFRSPFSTQYPEAPRE